MAMPEDPEVAKEPVKLMVTAPVAPDTPMAFPATLLVTPELVRVRFPEEELMVRPVEPVKVTAL